MYLEEKIKLAKIQIQNEEPFRNCSCCGILKELNDDNFNFKKDRLKYYTYCKDCTRIKREKYSSKPNNNFFELIDNLSYKIVNIDNFPKCILECSVGHIFDICYDSLRHDGHCKYCTGYLRSLQDAKDIAISRDGFCDSIKWENTSKNIWWRCKYNHKWQASFNDIYNGTWCPECSSGLYERICRTFCEKIFGYKFEKCRPNWLLNKTGYKLELDGYCHQLGIAFEHNGLQHYKTIKGTYFHNMNNYDDIKYELCKKNDVKLIIIPELQKIIKIKNLKNYIINECKKLKILNYNENIEISDLDIYSSALDEYKKIAELRGGKLLSSTYFGSGTNHLWECAEGHQWWASPNSIKNQKSWCRICSIKNRFKNEYKK